MIRPLKVEEVSFRRVRRRRNQPCTYVYTYILIVNLAVESVACRPDLSRQASTNIGPNISSRAAAAGRPGKLSRSTETLKDS